MFLKIFLLQNDMIFQFIHDVYIALFLSYLLMGVCSKNAFMSHKWELFLYSFHTSIKTMMWFKCFLCLMINCNIDLSFFVTNIFFTNSIYVNLNVSLRISLVYRVKNIFLQDENERKKSFVVLNEKIVKFICYLVWMCEYKIYLIFINFILI